MKRFEAIEEIMKDITRELVIGNIGFPSRELYEIRNRNENFYMLGSMGLASSIGLGIALSLDEKRNNKKDDLDSKQYNKKIIVLDGDGAILMNLGSLVTIANQNPSNFILICLDNESYGSTGNQSTYSKNSDLLEIAKSSGFKKAYDFDEINFKELLNSNSNDSIFIRFKIAPGNENVGIIDLTPEEIKTRFMNSI
ncbi:MAG: sulfopyruvate decarboxylase subunit beta [Methanobrevibacter sp.]|jgi:sulfopyruvate decarboxylase subunit beta|nr:sulfopyruvate decarboxylase subunit beta [Candidatus Methanoflexus mossambicus]